MEDALSKIGDGPKVNRGSTAKSVIQANHADPAQVGTLLLCSLQQRDLAQKGFQADMVTVVTHQTPWS
jgi:hypothetical protein